MKAEKVLICKSLGMFDAFKLMGFEVKGGLHEGIFHNVTDVYVPPTTLKFPLSPPMFPAACRSIIVMDDDAQRSKHGTRDKSVE